MSRLSDQITHLTVDIYHKTEEIRRGYEPNILPWILFVNRYLIDLIFSQQFSYNYFTFSSWDIQHMDSLSSTLIELRIKIDTFDDFLHRH